MTLDEIDITNNLIWTDEYSFNQVEQVAERSLTGGLVVQGGLKLFGRPITLEGWLSRGTLDALRAAESYGNTSMLLTLADDREFTVIFDRSRGIAIDAKPVFPYTLESTDNNWQYKTTLRFITVEPEPEEEPEE